MTSSQARHNRLDANPTNPLSANNPITLRGQKGMAQPPTEQTKQPSGAARHWVLKPAVVTDESVEQLAFFLQKNCVIPEDDLTGTAAESTAMTEAKAGVRLSLTSKKRKPWIEQRLGFIASLTRLKPPTAAQIAEADASTKQSFYWNVEKWNAIVQKDLDAHAARLKSIIQEFGDKAEQRRKIMLLKIKARRPHV